MMVVSGHYRLDRLCMLSGPHRVLKAIHLCFQQFSYSILQRRNILFSQSYIKLQNSQIGEILYSLIQSQLKITQMNKKTLSLPVLKKEDIVTAYSQIRPFREGGFRIQKQSFEGKTVFHNYGHGGSGISLSYGSAHKIADLFQAQVKNKQNFCAVLGSGVIGLTTALQLAQRGHKVRIYTKKIPTNGQKINKLMITSEVAPGFWFPYDYLDIRGQQILQLSALSMNFFKKSLQTNRYMALKACQTYDQVYSSEMIKKFDGIYLKNNTEVEVDLGNGAYQKFNQFGTVRIDMQLWLKELIVQLVRIGAQFIPRQFKNEGQVLALKQKFIFNCTGYASKYLFNDMKMKAHRGHIVQFLNPNPEVFNYIFGAKVNNQIVRIYGHQNRILLGLSKEQSEQIQVEEKIVEKLLNNYQSYLNRWSIPAAKL